MDSQRINRALEVFYITGKSLTELTEEKGEALPYDFVQFAIAPQDRHVLHERIEERFHKMIELGFQEEKTLYAWRFKYQSAVNSLCRVSSNVGIFAR